MRKRTMVCLLALCAALLSGCGGPTEGAKAYDPAAAVQALLDAKVFGQELVRELRAAAELFRCFSPITRLNAAGRRRRPAAFNSRAGR